MATLKPGSTGPAVITLQRQLTQLRLYVGPVDGSFGQGTETALISFQKRLGLKPDGVLGSVTKAALQQAVDDNWTTAAADVATNPPGLKQPVVLSEADFIAAATLLHCDVAAIKAVAEVESSGNGFLSDGRVKILFEGHQFYKFTNGAFAQSHPTICYKDWTKQFYTKGPNADVRGAGELARLEQAMALNRSAALMAASYGKFQIMGFNFPVCGFSNVDDFYDSMNVSEGEQLKAFCRYIVGNAIDDELRKHEWSQFAKHYNGADYLKNKYDQKLAAAHAKYSKS